MAPTPSCTTLPEKLYGIFGAQSHVRKKIHTTKTWQFSTLPTDQINNKYITRGDIFIEKRKTFWDKHTFLHLLSLLNFLSLVSTTSEAALFFFFFLSHSFSLSFSCFNPRNKNTTTTATIRFVTIHNQIRLAPALSYLGFSLSSQLWPNPWAPPPFLVVALTCATTTTSNHWPPLSLSAFISTFPFSVFGCI